MVCSLNFGASDFDVPNIRSSISGLRFPDPLYFPPKINYTDIMTIEKNTIANDLFKEDALQLIRSYASHPKQSRGRLYDEPSCPLRNPYQRDRDRIVHATAFRRLEYKTQVFVNHEGDHYRTRLTHSLEVAQIARHLARALGLCESLTEGLALAHDLGHPPFGHAGEDGLNEVMQAYGGFDHNAQTIRVLTKLENRYANFPGLNLTWETLEGIAKHNGPVVGEDIPASIIDYDKQHDLQLDSYPSLEAQAAAISDDIAYNNHDMDDGLRAGLFSIADIREVPFINEAFEQVEANYKDLTDSSLIHEANRRLIHTMIADVITTSEQRLVTLGIETVDDARQAGQTLIDFSDEMQQQNQELKAFLMERMYRHYKINRMSNRAQKVVKDLFTFFSNDPSCLPTNWQQQLEDASDHDKAIIICDYIAGMTDRFALKEHEGVVTGNR